MHRVLNIFQIYSAPISSTWAPRFVDRMLA